MIVVPSFYLRFDDVGRAAFLEARPAPGQAA